MKFEKSKVSALDGRTLVIFKVGSPDGFQVIASKQGIQFQGVSDTIEDRDGLDGFAALVDAAWREHLKLKVNIIPPDHQGNL